MKARSIFCKNALRPGVEHLFIVDDRGRVFERFSDEDPGVWSEIPLPKSNQQKRVERRKR